MSSLGIDSAQARSVCRSLTADRVRGCPRMRTSFVRRPGGAADIGLHRCTPLRSEVFGGGAQRQESLWGRGQPTPPPTALHPQQEVAPREPPLHFCVDFGAACCVLFGHDRAREVIVLADEQVTVTPCLMVHREFGAL